MNRTFALVIFSFAIISLAHLAEAQIPVLNGLQLTLSNDNPAPGESIVVTAADYSFNLDSVKISWVVDGKSVASGIGMKTITVTAPALGKSMKISVSATGPDGIASNSVTLSPGAVDMIVENDGYVPPFFRGKNPVSYQNTIKVTAIPHLTDSNGTEIDPRILIYNWRKNDSLIQEQSGYGKQSISLTGDIIPRPYSLSVDIYSQKGEAHTQGNASIEAVDPSITFYASDPLYGPLYNRAIGDQVSIGTQKELRVMSAPYGFNDGGTLAWSINGSEQGDLSTSRSIILRAPAGSAGISNIELTIQNAKKLLQGATAGFAAYYNVTTGSTGASSTNALNFN